TIPYKTSTRLIEGNTLPYQETQSFRDVIREFREKFVKTSEQSLISLSRHADKCKDLKQLFPPKNEDRETVTMASKSGKAVNSFKPRFNEYQDKRGVIHKAKSSKQFQNESFSEISSICSYSYGHLSGISTSADESMDNNNIP
ncbi:hypothetical protein DMN91_008745, partial [Ooceraea biroi]